MGGELTQAGRRRIGVAEHLPIQMHNLDGLRIQGGHSVGKRLPELLRIDLSQQPTEGAITRHVKPAQVPRPMGTSFVPASQAALLLVMGWPMKPSSPAGWESFLSLVKTRDLPDLGPRRRATAWPAAEVRKRVAGWLEQHGTNGPREALLLGAALLWHDHLHEAHALAQEESGADGSFLHAIMHRREPDYGNSCYWWNRVGSHPSFPALAGRVLELLTARQQPELAAQLLPGGRWSPGALVDACEVAADEPAGSPLVALLQEIQALEFETFVRHLLGT